MHTSIQNILAYFCLIVQAFCPMAGAHKSKNGQKMRALSIKPGEFLIASLFGSCYDMKGKSADFDGERLEATE